ncbi:hypothetical protein MRX96_006469 [Rhipicephalus microplus]
MYATRWRRLNKRRAHMGRGLCNYCRCRRSNRHRNNACANNSYQPARAPTGSFSSPAELDRLPPVTLYTSCAATRAIQGGKTGGHRRDETLYNRTPLHCLRSLINAADAASQPCHKATS